MKYPCRITIRYKSGKEESFNTALNADPKLLLVDELVHDSVLAFDVEDEETFLIVPVDQIESLLVLNK